MNTFTCIGKGHGAPAVPATRTDWEAMRRENWLASMCQRIRNGQEELKATISRLTPEQLAQFLQMAASGQLPVAQVNPVTNVTPVPATDENDDDYDESEDFDDEEI